jgi:hypothetical protein
VINKQHDARGVGVGLLGSIAYEQVNCDGRERGNGVNPGDCSKDGESIPTLIWFMDICNFRPAEIGQGLGKGGGDVTGKGLG